MNDDIAGIRRRQRRWPQLTGVLAVAVGVALLTPACGSRAPGGSGSSSQEKGSTTYQEDLAYAQCMRSRGVPNFPDPASGGTFVNNGINLESGTGKAAQTACKHLLPNGGVVPATQQQQRIQQLLLFAGCMRSHGEPKFPDPTANGLNLRHSGIDPQSPQFLAAQQACRSLMPKVSGRAGGGS